MINKIKRIIFDLLASSLFSYEELMEWELYSNGKIKLPYIHRDQEKEPIIFSREINVPDNRLKWFLKIIANGNGLVKIDGKTWAGIDEIHSYIPVEKGKHTIELIMYSRKLFGVKELFFEFKYAFLVGFFWELYILAMKLLNIIELVEKIPNSKLREDLLSLLSNILLEVRIVPSVKQIILANIFLYDIQQTNLLRKDLTNPLWDYKILTGLYSKEILEGRYKDLEASPPNEVIEETRRINEKLRKGLSELKKKYPKQGLIYIYGHTHIDAAWLWSFNETKQKILRTFSTFAKYLEYYPNIVIVQSSAQYYKWLEELDKELFHKIKTFIDKNKWIPIGGMWVESDVQLVTGESIARQFLYGQKYFLEKFGKTTKIGWLPDSFGYPFSLPQILCKSGIEVFVIHKIMWNQVNEFPYHSFIWKGIDGTEIPVQVLFTSYNEILSPSRVYTYWGKYKNKKETSFTILSYGYGNGGGGPTIEMIENIDLVNELPYIPYVRSISEKEYVEEIRKVVDKLPIWNDELYLEAHRGTYTTNLTIKKLMAEAESILRSAEIASTISEILNIKNYPKEKIESLWKKILLHQFHDILPGSAVKEVYEEAINDLVNVINEAKSIINESLGSLPRKNELLIYNDLPWPRNGVIILDNTNICLEDPDNNPVYCQIFENKTYIYVTDIPPLGYKIFKIKNGYNELSNHYMNIFYDNEHVVLENEKLRIKINFDGEITSIFNKELSKEIIRKNSNVLIVHPDRPGVFDAWEITDDFLKYGEKMVILDKPRILCKGPVIGCIEYNKIFRNSRIKQRICIYRSSSIIEIKSFIDWHDKLVLVKAWYDFNIKSKAVYYEIPYGVISRSSEKNTSWEKAKFEAPALRWIDFSNKNYGIAIISFSRHGYSTFGSKIGLSMLKSPIFPNPWSDLGRETFTYYLYPHQGTWSGGEVVNIAQELWSPLKIIYPKNNNNINHTMKKYALAQISPYSNIELSALKKTENGDGYILRITNYNEIKTSILIKLSETLNKIIDRIRETNIIETEDGKEYSLQDSILKIELNPYEIKTIKLMKR